jgi:hypothetical protein
MRPFTITNAPHQRGAPKHYSVPIERIESLRSALHFRLLLEGNSVNDLEVVR